MVANIGLYASQLWSALYNTKSAQASELSEANGGKADGMLNSNQAYAAMQELKDSGAYDKLNLPKDIKDKFANGLTMDVFNQADPLGVRDGQVNLEEFSKLFDKNVDSGNGLRGVKGFSPDDMKNAGYLVPGADGKGDRVSTASNTIRDLENQIANAGIKGQVPNGNITLDELNGLMTSLGNSGNTAQKNIVGSLIDNYSTLEDTGVKGITAAKLADALKNPDLVDVTKWSP
jgi:hypothetical protein